MVLLAISALLGARLLPLTKKWLIFALVLSLVYLFIAEINKKLA
jgi:hypothetical protein